MSPFPYLRDRLFLLSCSLYVLNRWVLKPHFHNQFLHDHFNDLLLMPCALPPLLLMQHWLGLRPKHQPPTLAEIGLYLFVWSILFEVIGPHLMRRAVGDPWDIVAYAAGAVFAALWWHRDKFRTPRLVP